MFCNASDPDNNQRNERSNNHIAVGQLAVILIGLAGAPPFNEEEQQGGE